MLKKQDFFIDVSHVVVAHEFVLRAPRGTAYPNGREHYGLIVPIEGEAEYCFPNGEHVLLHAGEVLFLSPHAAYSIRLLHDFRHYTVNFDIHEESSTPFFQDKCYTLLKTDSIGSYRNAMRELTALHLHGKNGGEMREVGYVYELLALFFFDLSMEKKDKNAYRRILPVKTYIEQNYMREIRLETLAVLAHMSVTNFRREFRKVFGETAMQYRDRIRIASAKEYLLGGYTITETALSCGFFDMGYFIRFFKKHVGVTPRIFQNRF